MSNEFWAFAVGIPFMEEEEERTETLDCIVCGWAGDDSTEFLEDDSGQHMCWSCVYLMEK